MDTPQILLPNDGLAPCRADRTYVLHIITCPRLKVFRAFFVLTNPICRYFRVDGGSLTSQYVIGWKQASGDQDEHPYRCIPQKEYRELLIHSGFVLADSKLLTASLF